MASAKNKQIVVKDDGSVVTTIMPDFMEGEEKKGLESLDDTDFVLPIVKLMQATDEDVQTGLVAAGNFWHKTAKTDLGKNIRFIPCHIRKRYMLFRPNDGSGGTGSNVLARADDGVNWNVPNAQFEVTPKGTKRKVVWYLKGSVAESGLDKFGSSDPEDPMSNPAATLIYDIVAILPDSPDMSPAVISLKGSAITRAKNLFTGLKMSKAPIWGHVFNAKGSLEKNGSNNYWAYTIDGAGFVNNKDLFDQGKELHDIIAQTAFKVNEEDEPEAPPATAVNDKY